MIMEEAEYEIPIVLIQDYIKSSLSQEKEDFLELKETWEKIQNKYGEINFNAGPVIYEPPRPVTFFCNSYPKSMIMSESPEDKSQ